MSDRSDGAAFGRWLDATRALTPGHPVWPGDTPFTLERTARLEAGDSVNLTRLVATLHLGTHLDGVWHYDAEGATVDAVPLDVLIGPGLVAAVPGAATPVGADELPDGPLPGRVLLHTGQADVWDTFPEAFRPLSVAAVERLAERGVRLIGTDAPSVDAVDSRDLPVHHACGRAGIAIVESLALAAIPPGAYDVMCLPLRLVGGDAAPARVIVRPAGDR